jgi:hypothetical protein
MVIMGQMNETGRLADAIPLLCARATPNQDFYRAYLERILTDPAATATALNDLVEIAWTLLDQLAPPDVSRETIAQTLLAHDPPHHTRTPT